MSLQNQPASTSSSFPFWHYLALGVGALAFISSIQSFRNFGKLPDPDENTLIPEKESSILPPKD